MKLSELRPHRIAVDDTGQILPELSQFEHWVDDSSLMHCLQHMSCIVIVRFEVWNVKGEPAETPVDLIIEVEPALVEDFHHIFCAIFKTFTFPVEYPVSAENTSPVGIEACFV